MEGLTFEVKAEHHCLIDQAVGYGTEQDLVKIFLWDILGIVKT